MKRLIVCCVGTWNRADQRRDGTPIPANVIRLAYHIGTADQGGTPQVVCYIQGVGTGNGLDHWLGGALSADLEEHLYEAYRFLVANYAPGDEIYLFGFSRGAFTARSLAGLLRNAGILSRAQRPHALPGSSAPTTTNTHRIGHRVSEVDSDDSTACPAATA